MSHKETPDLADCIAIKRAAERLIVANGQLTLGRAVYYIASSLFYSKASRLAHTEFDCYNDDSKIDLFLLELRR